MLTGTRGTLVRDPAPTPCPLPREPEPLPCLNPRCGHGGPCQCPRSPHGPRPGRGSDVAGPPWRRSDRWRWSRSTPPPGPRTGWRAGGGCPLYPPAPPPSPPPPAPRHPPRSPPPARTPAPSSSGPSINELAAAVISKELKIYLPPSPCQQRATATV